MILTNDFVFIHYPKNGGSFVTKCLQEVYDGSSSKTEDKKLKDYFLYLINKEQTNYATKYMSKALGQGGKKIRTQHQGCDEIPAKHNDKPIVSTIRNPFDRYVSLYNFGWWKTNTVFKQQELKEIFPNFPDLNFEEYLDLLLNYKMEVTKQKIDITADIGISTLQFIKLFGKNYLDILSSVNDVHELNDDDFYDVTFLYQENLREDLFSYLQNHEWPKHEISFIYEREKVNTSRTNYTYRNYYTQETRDLIKQKEALIFNLFPDYSF